MGNYTEIEVFHKKEMISYRGGGRSIPFSVYDFDQFVEGVACALQLKGTFEIKCSDDYSKNEDTQEIELSQVQTFIDHSLKEYSLFMSKNARTDDESFWCGYFSVDEPIVEIPHFCVLFSEHDEEFILCYGSLQTHNNKNNVYSGNVVHVNNDYVFTESNYVRLKTIDTNPNIGDLIEFKNHQIIKISNKKQQLQDELELLNNQKHFLQKRIDDIEEQILKL